LKNVKFTSPKLKKVVHVLNPLVEKKIEKAYLVAKIYGESYATNLNKSYIDFIQKLAQYDAGKISKKEMRAAGIKFLKAYRAYKKAFNSLVKVEKVNLR